MAGFQVGTSYLGGPNVLGGGEDGMNTSFNLFHRGELFPFVSTLTTAGFGYFNRGEVYPAIYVAPTASTATVSKTGISLAIGIGGV